MRAITAGLKSLTACLALASVASAQTVIDFENLASGTPVTTQYPQAWFSSTFNNQNVVLQGAGGNNVLCTGPVSGGVTCVESTFIVFPYPVNDLMIDAVEPNDAGVVARVNIYENGFFTAVEDIVGLGGPGTKTVDLSAYVNVTRIELVNILDVPGENGVAWDNFSFTQNTSPFVYCTAQVNSSGCTPAIGFSGVPSKSAGSGFFITADNVFENAQAILIYSKNASNSIPFLGGTLCVGPPDVWRSGLLLSSNPMTGVCDGVLSFDFNEWIATGPDKLIPLGQKIWCQYWSRDIPAPSGANLTDAVAFVVGF